MPAEGGIKSVTHVSKLPGNPMIGETESRMSLLSLFFKEENAFFCEGRKGRLGIGCLAEGHDVSESLRICLQLGHELD